MPLTNAFFIIVLMLMALLVFQLLGTYYRAEKAAKSKLRHLSRNVVYTVQPSAVPVNMTRQPQVRASFLSVGNLDDQIIRSGIEYHLPSVINRGQEISDQDNAVVADCQSCA